MNRVLSNEWDQAVRLKLESAPLESSMQELSSLKQQSEVTIIIELIIHAETEANLYQWVSSLSSQI